MVMFSDLIRAKSKLPIDFIENLYKDLGQKNAEKCLMGMCQERYTTLRINSLKSNTVEIEEQFDKLGICFEKVSFYDDAYIIKNKNEKDLQNLDIYKDGKIYLQSLSSMVPVLALEPKENEKILDLTAAPGSKTTQIAAITKNKAKILANEIDKIRFERLKYNINLQGANAEAINSDGVKINEKYNDYFDRTLIDAPCSGEGRFLIEKKESYLKWSEKMKEELAKLQKELLHSAIKATKKGGVIVYSTCTLNKKEDEDIVNFAVKNYGVRVEKIDLKIKNALKIKHEGDCNSLKIIPSEIMEGFYIAKLVKI